MKRMKQFKSGTVLNASDLDNIYSCLAHIAKKADISIKPKPNWKDGSILTAALLNSLLKDVEKVAYKLEKNKINWSFDQFEDGQVLKAEQLNEIVDRIQKYI